MLIFMLLLHCCCWIQNERLTMGTHLAGLACWNARAAKLLEYNQHSLPLTLSMAGRTTKQRSCKTYRCNEKIGSTSHRTKLLQLNCELWRGIWLIHQCRLSASQCLVYLSSSRNTDFLTGQPLRLARALWQWVLKWFFHVYHSLITVAAFAV